MAVLVGLGVAALVVQLLGRLAELLEAGEAGLVKLVAALLLMDAEQLTAATEVILPCWAEGEELFHLLMG